MKPGNAGLVEAIMFAAGESVSVEDLRRWTSVSDSELDEILHRLSDNGRGVIARRFGNRVQLVTNPEFADILREIFVQGRENELSAALMETLSIVAYRQPVTRLEIEDIRGVRCAYAISALCDRGLIERTGVRDVLGHPAEYGTTEQFLRQFDLRGLEDLPRIDELKQNSQETDT